MKLKAMYDSKMHLGVKFFRKTNHTMHAPVNQFNNICKWRNLHLLSQLVCVIIQSYTMLQVFNESVLFYQATPFMFYNVRTTY